MAEYVADLKYIFPLGDVSSTQYGVASYKRRRGLDGRWPTPRGGGDADRDVSPPGGRNLNLKSIGDI